MQLQPSEISDLIKSKIQNLDTHAEVRTQGTVVSVTDGICRVHGLSDAMAGEMLEFPGNTFGLALNLERDSVGAVILGQYEHITEGDTVKCTGKILSVPIGPELIGRVVDSLGNPIEPATFGQVTDLSTLTGLTAGTARFLRFDVSFDIDALGAGLDANSPKPALDFIRVPFRY